MNIYQESLNVWQPDFKTRVVSYKTGPAQNRSCTDIACLVIFIVFLLGFIGVGAYFIDQGWKNQQSIVTISSYLNLKITSDLRIMIGIIIGMVSISIFLGFIFIMLINSFPTCMLYTLIIAACLFLLALTIISFIYGSIAAGIVITIILAIYILILVCCLRSYIKIAVVFCKLSAQFILSNKIIFLLPIIITLIIVSFAIFWLASVVGITSLLSSHQISDQTGTGLYALFSVFYIFFTYFFYYMMVFLNSSSVAVWFYNRADLKILWSGFNQLFYHLGSITFASIIITIIKIIQYIAGTSQRQGKNCCATICLFMFRCFLSCLEVFTKIMNHYSTIMMSLTGQNFINSAKSAGVIIFSEIELFLVISAIIEFFFYTGLCFVVVLPTFLSVIVSKYNNFVNEIILVGVLVFLLSIMVGVIMLSLFTETVSSIFLFFGLEHKLAQYNIKALNILKQIQQLYEQAFVDSGIPNQWLKNTQKMPQSNNILMHGKSTIIVTRSKLQALNE